MVFLKEESYHDLMFLFSIDIKAFGGKGGTHHPSSNYLHFYPDGKQLMI